MNPGDMTIGGFIPPFRSTVFARVGIAAVALVGALVGAACSPCESLEESICDELGEDCSLWREAGSPGMPGGRRSFRQCVNASFGPSHDAIVVAARASVDALKKTKQ